MLSWPAMHMSSSLHPAGAHRTTRQKLALERMLAACADFRSAQDLHAQLRADGARVGLTTVYNNLRTLAERGGGCGSATRGGGGAGGCRWGTRRWGGVACARVSAWFGAGLTVSAIF